MTVSTSMSAGGSEVFSATALITLSAFVLLILRCYLPLRTTPAFVLVTVFFALWLPTAIVLLVPIDLASSAQTGDKASRGIILSERVIHTCWRVVYWLIFFLTWFILPVLAEYSDAGYREPKDKLTYSLRQNAQYYAMVFGLGILAFIYVVVSYGLHLDSLKSPVMALAYCWGLVFAIYLMGHGLVSIPRSLVRNASVSGRLRRIQSQAPRLYDMVEEAEINLGEIKRQIVELSRRKTGTAVDFQDWIEELVDFQDLEAQPQDQSATGPAATRRLPTVITENFLAELARELSRARHALSRHVSEWNCLLRDAAEAQAILDCGPSKKLEYRRTEPHASWWGRTSVLTPYTRYLLHFHVLPIARMTFGGLLSLASICIVWSEIVKVGPATLARLSIIRLTVVHHWTGERGQVGFLGQVIAALWISYMCAAALNSITEVKVWRGRALVWRNTAHESAFWYSSYVARLSVPLAYNFITFLSRDIYERTQFYEFLGNLIDLTALGSWFNRLFPLFILVPVSATLFGLYGKVKRTVGLAEFIEDDYEDADGYGTGSWREGRALIERQVNGTSFSRPHALLASEDHVPIRSIPCAPYRAGSPTTLLGEMPDVGLTKASTAAGSSRGTGAQSSHHSLSGSENEDDNFFSTMGTRIKNTVDALDTPKWLQGITKTPKWMSDDDEGGNGRRTGSGDNGFDVRRWFGGAGGSSSSGRIRL